MSETSLRAAAWLLTYALHSTVLLALAALLTARWVRGEAWRETLWKAALVGGLVTATVQSTGWMGSDLGAWRIAVLPPAESASPATAAPIVRSPADDQPSQSSALEANRSDAPVHTTPATTAPLESAPAASAPSTTADPSAAPARLPGTLLGWALLAWALGALVMLGRLGLRQAPQPRLLAGRAPVDDDEVFAMLAALRRNAGIWRPVHLTTCAATPTPLALGGGEICVPPRFLTGLDAEQQRSALAHELAHVARRDPAWHFGVSILEALFWFQPLNRLARARLRESAEFLCDEWAARQTGSPLGLARCLAEVASWVAPGRNPIPAGTMAMAEGGSPLVQRVQRLTSWRGAPREGSGIARVAAAVAMVAAVAAIAPAVASTDGTAPTETASAPSAASTAGPDSAELAGMDRSAREIVVIRHPDPGQPLAQRRAWAAEEVARRGLNGAWIAWSVPTTVSPGPTWLADASEEGRTTVNQRLGAPADHSMMLFTVDGDGELEYAVGHSAVVDLSRHPVLWLGPARGDESFTELRRMADGLRDPDQRARLVEAIGIHDAPGVVPYLAAVLGRDGSDGARKQAVSALGRHGTDESVAALRAAARRDGSDEVRREAVDALARLRVAGSGAVLHDLALRASDLEIRLAAVEALGENLDAEGMRTLSAIASLDRDPAARTAVEAMENGAPRLATPELTRIAWTSGNGEVARQAAESLGRLPAAWSLAALDSIARRHPNPAVARQAVESLGRVPAASTTAALDAIARTHPDPGVARQAVESLGRHRGAEANGFIRQIARTHPNPRVREEARDQLRAADARQGIGGDPDADADPDAHAENDHGDDADSDPDFAVDVGGTSIRLPIQFPDAARMQARVTAAARP